MNITQRIKFECCYVGQKPVAELNAHSYILEATISGQRRYSDLGYILDFSRFETYLKNVVPNNKFLVSDLDMKSCRIGRAFECEGFEIRRYDFVLSTEALCNRFAVDLQKQLDEYEPGLIVSTVKLRESNDSFATWNR